MKKLRLVLGDQLNINHSWYSGKDEGVTYLLAEMRQETDYVKHHVQKVVAFFLAMRNFARQLEESGHKVIYLAIDDPSNPQELGKILRKYIEETNSSRFEYQYPDEYRLDHQLKSICQGLSIPSEAYDTEHFFTTRQELAEFFKNRKQIIMESFYRMMRKKHDILMEGGVPAGGQWNFDKSNRKKWQGDPEIPRGMHFNKGVKPILKALENAGVNTFGHMSESTFNWPTSREECRSALTYFCEELLPYFGDYQDAMHSQEAFLFHSRLSFAMNSKLLSPKEVISEVTAHYKKHHKSIHISQVEGFVRQILGWREFMRGIYWKEMPQYKECNTLGNHRKLPDFFWTGKTRMQCLKSAVGQSLDTAYAHHIQRLMVIGNFALLAQLHPDEVDSWYLGVYIDAIEWVELPNTRGMSQYADGGLVATKPYVSSANYIDKMSNYCNLCPYNPRKKTGSDACPFNALYWNFLHEKKEHFRENRRMGLMLSLLDKKDPAELAALKKRAQIILQEPDNF